MKIIDEKNMSQALTRVAKEIIQEKNEIDNMILIQEEQPTSPDNKLWVVVDNEDTVFIPTAEEFNLLKERVDNLEYEPLIFNSLSVSPNLAEAGSTVTNATLTYNMNKNASQMKLDNVDISNTSASGTIPLTELSISSNKTWTLKAQDEKQAAEDTWVSKTTTLTFTNKVKYGVAAIPETIGDTFLNNLTTKTLSTGKIKSFSVNAGPNQYIWYALPTNYGTCTFTVGGFSGGFSLVETFNHINESGTSVEYRVYRSDNSNLGSTTVTVA